MEIKLIKSTYHRYGNFTIIGIIIGIIGIILIAVNYPIYKKILEESKSKYSYDIIKLAKEIAQEEK